jgi:hypothetical protein
MDGGGVAIFPLVSVAGSHETWEGGIADRTVFVSVHFFISDVFMRDRSTCGKEEDLPTISPPLAI